MLGFWLLITEKNRIYSFLLKRNIFLWLIFVLLLFASFKNVPIVNSSQSFHKNSRTCRTMPFSACKTESNQPLPVCFPWCDDVQLLSKT